MATAHRPSLFSSERASIQFPELRITSSDVSLRSDYWFVRGVASL
jgi:hypothetical protein